MIDKEVLKKFLAPEGETSDHAWIKDGKTIVCDSRIALVLNEERRDIEKFKDSGDRFTFTHVMTLMKNFSGSEPQFTLPEEPVELKKTRCKTCEGVGLVMVCETCDGDGEHSCECGDEHECKRCKGTGYYPFIEKKHDKDDANECLDCENGVVTEQKTVQVGLANILGYQINLLQLLPKPVTLCIKSAEDLVFFVFDGGKGVLMPNKGLKP